MSLTSNLYDYMNVRNFIFGNVRKGKKAWNDLTKTNEAACVEILRVLIHAESTKVTLKTFFDDAKVIEKLTQSDDVTEYVLNYSIVYEALYDAMVFGNDHDALDTLTKDTVYWEFMFPKIEDRWAALVLSDEKACVEMLKTLAHVESNAVTLQTFFDDANVISKLPLSADVTTLVLDYETVLEALYDAMVHGMDRNALNELTKHKTYWTPIFTKIKERWDDLCTTDEVDCVAILNTLADAGSDATTFRGIFENADAVGKLIANSTVQQLIVGHTALTDLLYDVAVFGDDFNVLAALTENAAYWNPIISKIQTGFSTFDWNTLSTTISKAAAVKPTSFEASLSGLTRKITIDDVIYTYRVIGFGHDEDANDNKIGFTFQCTNVISEQPMSSVDTEGNGYAVTELRTWLTETLYETFPDDVKAVMVAAKKPYSTYVDNTVVDEGGYVADKIWIASMKEVDISNSSYGREGTAYYFWDKSSTSYLRMLNMSNTRTSWWVRSVYSGLNYFAFVRVSSSSATITYNTADISYGVVPCFCV